MMHGQKNIKTYEELDLCLQPFLNLAQDKSHIFSVILNYKHTIIECICLC